jgi:hypothetical protein
MGFTTSPYQAIQGVLWAEVQLLVSLILAPITLALYLRAFKKYCQVVSPLDFPKLNRRFL